MAVPVLVMDGHGMSFFKALLGMEFPYEWSELILFLQPSCVVLIKLQFITFFRINCFSNLLGDASFSLR